MLRTWEPQHASTSVNVSNVLPRTLNYGTVADEDGYLTIRLENITASSKRASKIVAFPAPD